MYQFPVPVQRGRCGRTMALPWASCRPGMARVPAGSAGSHPGAVDRHGRQPASRAAPRVERGSGNATPIVAGRRRARAKPSHGGNGWPGRAACRAGKGTANPGRRRAARLPPRRYQAGPRQDRAHCLGDPRRGRAVSGHGLCAAAMAANGAGCHGQDRQPAPLAARQDGRARPMPALADHDRLPALRAAA